jgi:iron complex outermembrane recepter protein
MSVGIAVACLIGVGTVVADPALAAIRKQTSLPAQELAAALQALARDRDVQVVYRSEIVGDRATQGAAGDLTLDEALTQLLRGTGLTFRYLDEKAITIVPLSTPTAGAAPQSADDRQGTGDSHKSLWSRLRLAQADQSGATTGSGTLKNQGPDHNSATEPQSAGGQVELQEVVVTALLRSTTLETTPAAITVVNGDTLQKMGIENSQDLERVAPGLIVTESSIGGARITLRNIWSPGEATTGLYYDEVPIIGSPGVSNDAGGTTPIVSLFDVERVEVLRGPQGTLYGSGSEAGTVKLVFAKPELDAVDGAVDLQGTDVKGGNAGGRAEGAVNMPLINGTLAVRAAGFYDTGDGYIDNSVLHDNNVNGHRNEGGRILLRYRPLSSLTFDAMLVIQDKSGWINDWSLNTGPYVENDSARQPMDDNLTLFSGTVNWDLDLVNLTLVGSHSRRDLEYQYDFPFFDYVAGLVPPGSALQQLALSQYPAAAYAPQSTTVSTQEVRVTSQPGQPLQWTLGLFHSQRDANILSTVQGVDAGGYRVPSELYYRRTIGDDLGQTAGYGEGTYSITKQWDFTFGTRYYHYDRETDGAVTTGNLLVGSPASPYASASTDADGWLYKINTNYRFTPRIMAYAQASEGYRPGGVNQVVGLPQNLGPYAPDSLWDYEVGLKTTWLDRRLQIDADVFQINWKNMQVSGTSTAQANGATFSLISNAGNARIRGIEFETTYEPVKSLSLHVSGSYMDSVLTSNQVSVVIAAPGKAGEPIPYAPTLTLQAGAQYEAPLAGGLNGLLRLDASYNTDSWTQFTHTSAFQDLLPAYTNVSMRIGVSDHTRDWTASLFANNLLNQLGIVNKTATVLYGSADAVRAVSITPRTIGVELSKRF